MQRKQIFFMAASYSFELDQRPGRAVHGTHQPGGHRLHLERPEYLEVIALQGGAILKRAKRFQPRFSWMDAQVKMDNP